MTNNRKPYLPDNDNVRIPEVARGNGGQLKFSGAGVVTPSRPPPPTNNFCLYPHFKMFLKRFLNDPYPPHHPTSSIFYCYHHHPPPLPPPRPVPDFQTFKFSIFAYSQIRKLGFQKFEIFRHLSFRCSPIVKYKNLDKNNQGFPNIKQNIQLF